MINAKTGDRILTVIFALGCIYFLVDYLSLMFHTGNFSSSATSIGTAVFDVDSFDVTPPVPRPYETMTWSQFKEIEQHNKEILQLRDDMDRGWLSGMSVGPIGTYSISNCDTCTSLRSEFDTLHTIRRYYISLSGYRLAQDTVYHFRNGKNYLRYPIWDVISNHGGQQMRNGHYTIKEVPFRFKYADFENRTWESKGELMVQVNQRTYKILSTAMKISFGIYLTALLYIFLFLPARILARIAQGQAFTRKNIRQLHLIAWTILIGIALLTFSRIILRFVFRKYITHDLHFDYFQTVTDNGWLILAAAVFFIIAKAFKKGYNLQNDQDLTI